VGKTWYISASGATCVGEVGQIRTAAARTEEQVQTGRFFLPPTSGPAGPLILDHLDPPIRPAGALSPPHPAEFTVAAAHGEGAEPAAAARVTGPARQERPPAHPLGQPAAATLSRPRVHIGRVVTARR